MALASLAWNAALYAAGPFAHTCPATYLRSTNATLNGLAMPNGSPALAWFEWGTNDSYGHTTPPMDIGGGGPVNVSAGVTGLNNGGAYQYRLVASNSIATTFGAARVFTTGKRVISWGTNFYGAVDVPAGFTNAVFLACGSDHTIALRNDGSWLGWGDNYWGQSTIPATLTQAVTVAAGGWHSLALNADGTVTPWGLNFYGQSDVPPGLSNVIAVADGFSHCLALKADGTLAAWGSNDSGQTTLPAGLSNVVEIAAGNGHSLALKADGSVVGWGALGPAPTGLSNIVSITCGGNFCLACTADRSVAGWGIDVPPGLTGITAVSASSAVAFLLKGDGTLLTFGNNRYGQTNVPPTLANVALADGGTGHAMAIGNHRPQATSQAATGPANGDLVLVLASSDLDSDALTLRITSLPQFGALYQFSNGVRGPLISTVGTILTDPLARVIFAPLPDAFGAPYDAFIFEADDGQARSAPATVSLNIVARPCAFTQPATGIRTNRGTLNGMAAANGFPGVAWFEWGPRGGYGQTTPPVALTNVFPAHFQAEIEGMAEGGVYQCRLVTSNAHGVAFGAVHWFTTGKGAGAWGYNSVGQANAPGGLHDVVAIASGTENSLGLRVNSTVVAWGNTNIATLLAPPPGLSNVIAITCGGQRSLVLKADGTVEAWGSHAFGDPTPPTGLSNVVAVADGDHHSLALQADGQVVAWGGNERGQMNLPVGLEHVIAVACGDRHSLALKADGTVAAWGWNSVGQATVPEGLSNVVAIAGGGQHSVALKADGTVTAWGYSDFGVTAVPAGLSNVVAIAACENQTLALRTDGTVVGWGIDYTGLPADFTNYVAVAAGYRFGTAIGNHVPRATSQTLSGSANHDLVVTLSSSDADGDALRLRVASLPQIGTLYQYANGARGPAILAANTQVSDPGSRVIFAPLANDFARPYASFTFVASDGELDSSLATVTLNVLGQPGSFTLPPTAVHATNATLNGMALPNGFPTVAWFEWGSRGAFTQSGSLLNLGDGAAVIHLAAPIAGLTNRGLYQYRLVASNSVGLVAGATRFFATGKKPIAWGYVTSYGVPDSLTNAVALACGTNHSTALRADGTVTAWGLNNYGQTNVPAGLTNIVMVAAGANHNLALGADGTVTAWGNNSSGQTNVPSALSNVVALAGGLAHSLALLTDGTVAAWGANSNGQCAVPSSLNNVVSVAAGAEFSLALKADGTVAAWGRNEHGQCNVPANLTNAVAVATSYWAGLALRADGTIAAWGDNSAAVTNVPANLSNVVAVAGGATYASALKMDGNVVVWGYPSGAPPSGFTNGVDLAAGAQHTLAIGNQPPLSASVTRTTYVNSDTAFAPPAMDPNGDPLSYRIVSLPAAGTLFQYDAGQRGLPFTALDTLVSDPLGRIIFAPAADALGSPYTSFSFLANDGELNTPVRTVTINVILPCAPLLSPEKSGWAAPGYALNFSGASNATYRVWASTNLAEWEPVGTASMTSNGWYQFLDLEATNRPCRFYRAGAP